LIPLEEQDRTRWDRATIADGSALLEGALRRGEPGPYQVQAAIAACHANAPDPASTDWVEIAALYRELSRMVPSPVVELNRAVAVSMAYGPAAGLELADQLASGGALASYHLLPSVRGDLLAKLGRYEEARTEFERAATLTQNARETALLLARAAACRRGSAPQGPDLTT